MGQSLDCWENEFLLPNCFPQKYLLAAEIIVLALLTVTHFEMYFERGLGSLLAAFPYKEQALVCNPTQHIKAFAAGPSSFLILCEVWVFGPAILTSWAAFSPYYSVRSEELPLEVLHCLWKKPMFSVNAVPWVQVTKGLKRKRDGTHLMVFLACMLSIVPVKISSCFVFVPPLPALWVAKALYCSQSVCGYFGCLILCWYSLGRK